MAKEDLKKEPKESPAPDPDRVKYIVKEAALRLDSGLITLGAQNQTITLRPEGWQGIVAASDDDLAYLYAMGHPFVVKK